jgi:branched-chain amino acid transport system permease protein
MFQRILSKDLPRSRWLSGLLLLLVLALAFTPFIFPGVKPLNVAAKVLIFIVLVASFDLLLGYTGIVSFAHTMFFGIGAYGIAIATTRLGATWEALAVGLSASLLLSFVLALVVGLFSLRVRAIFFAMITLAVASAFLTLASQLHEFTGGEDGLSFKVPEILSPSYEFSEQPFLGVSLDGRLLCYYLLFVMAVVLFLALLRIVNSPFGRVLQAIRENEFRAEAIGYRVVVYRTTSSILSALFACMAGAMLALWLRYNGPDTSLSFEIMMDVLLIVVIGGMGTMYGAVVGAALFLVAQSYLQELLRLGSEAVVAWPMLSALLSPDRWLLWLGVLFVLSVYYFPTGVVGRLRQAAAVLVLGTAAVASSAQAADLTVVQVAPLTGVLSSTGQQMVLGGKIYFDWVNDQGGIHGAKIKHVVVDDGYKVEETVRLTKEALDKPETLALFGFAGTANIAKLLSDGVLEAGGAPLVGPYTGGEVLRNPFNPYIFHVRAGYADETEHMVNQVATLGMSRIAVMYQNDAFGKAGLAGVEAAVAKRKMTLVVAAPYERNTDQVQGAVKLIKASDAQAVIMISVNRSTAAFAAQYREAGGGGQLYNISVVDPAELIKLAGFKSVHGLGISQVVPYPFMASKPAVREYQTLLQKYGNGQPINYTSFEEFLAAKVLVEGLRRAGPGPTRAKLVKALESMDNFDLGGTRVGFSSSNRIGSRYVEVTVIGSNGKLMR